MDIGDNGFVPVFSHGETRAWAKSRSIPANFPKINNFRSVIRAGAIAGGFIVGQNRVVASLRSTEMPPGFRSRVAVPTISTAAGHGTAIAILYWFAILYWNAAVWRLRRSSRETPAKIGRCRRNPGCGRRNRQDCRRAGARFSNGRQSAGGSGVAQGRHSLR